MDWIKLLIPLIAIAVWILSHLASNQREQPRRPAPRPQPDGDNPRGENPRPRSSSAELESFLEEMRQRKQYDKDQPVEPVVVEEAPRPKPPPVPRREPPRREDRRDDRRKSRSVGSKPPQRRSEPVIVVTPEAAPLSAMPPARSSAPLITAGATPVQLTLSVAPPTVGTSSGGPLTLQHLEAPKMQTAPAPAARMVRELLKNRQSLGAVILLREILDRPLSQRPRSRFGR
jgi:hypothetical protein